MIEHFYSTRFAEISVVNDGNKIEETLLLLATRCYQYYLQNWSMDFFFALTTNEKKKTSTNFVFSLYVFVFPFSFDHIYLERVKLIRTFLGLPIDTVHVKKKINAVTAQVPSHQTKFNTNKQYYTKISFYVFRETTLYHVQ